jgi:hypothetical protein
MLGLGHYSILKLQYRHLLLQIARFLLGAPIHLFYCYETTVNYTTNKVRTANRTTIEMY